MSQYSSEFRREAVKLAQSTDKPTNQIAAELGIKAHPLYQWMSRAMKNNAFMILFVNGGNGQHITFISEFYFFNNTL